MGNGKDVVWPRVDRPAKTRFPDCFARPTENSTRHRYLCNQLRNNTIKIDYGVPSVSGYVSFETSYYYWYIRTPTDVYVVKHYELFAEQMAMSTLL